MKNGFAIAVAFLAGFVIVTGLEGQSTSRPPDRAGYIVGPRDVLAIAVWGEDDLTGRYAVDEDGTFMFPLAGRITAAGRTVNAIEADLRDGLGKRYLKNPQISVAVDQYRSQRIYVMGEVQQPGSLQLTGPMSLIEALARAGSTTQRAGAEALIVRAAAAPVTAGERRAGVNGSEVIRVPLAQLQRGDLTANIALRDGDTIFVPRGETVFVFGEVSKPGEYVVQPGMTVLQVLAVAGGLTDRGSTRRLRLVRMLDGTVSELKAELSDTVRPGDTLVVGERVF